jgi:hypothetical protein
MKDAHHLFEQIVVVCLEAWRRHNAAQLAQRPQALPPQLVNARQDSNRPSLLPRLL